MYKDWDEGITPPNQCLSGETFGVEARDYTPYYYFIMSTSLIMSSAFIILLDPSMRRSSEDEIKEIKA